MHNVNIPTHVELPTSRQLMRSTVIAIAAAATLLITVVLPAEYAIDPTGIGRALRLTEMGEIKKQLALEVEADEKIKDAPSLPAASKNWGSSLMDSIWSVVGVRSAAAHTNHDTDDVAVAARSDSMTVKLAPSQGAEVKVITVKGAKVNFSWTSDGRVNFETHGEAEGSSKPQSYNKGRDVTKDEGTIVAAFDGQHGWFWRNRGRTEVTITLKVEGDYSQLKRVM